MKCPSCGWEQEEGAECVACGIVFAKFRPRTPPPAPEPPGEPAGEPETVPPPAPPASLGGGANPPAEAGGDDPWRVAATVRAQPGELPHRDLYDPAAAPPPPSERIGGIRAIRVMPRIGALDTLTQALEAILQRPLWFGGLLLLQIGYVWLLSQVERLFEVILLAGLGLVLVGFVAASAMVGFRASDRGLPLALSDILRALVRTPRYLVAIFVFGIFLGVLMVGPGVGAILVLGSALGPVVALVWVAIVAVAGMAIFGITGPAAVDERLGPIRALGRSRQLTEGSRPAIIGSQVLLGAAGWLLQAIPRAGVLAYLSWSALAFHSLLGTTWWAVLYYRLRSLHEGVPMDELESSLDPVWNAEPESGLPA